MGIIPYGLCLAHWLVTFYVVWLCCIWYPAFSRFNFHILCLIIWRGSQSDATNLQNYARFNIHINNLTSSTTWNTWLRAVEPNIIAQNNILHIYSKWHDIQYPHHSLRAWQEHLASCGSRKLRWIIPAGQYSLQLSGPSTPEMFPLGVGTIHTERNMTDQDSSSFVMLTQEQV